MQCALVPLNGPVHGRVCGDKRRDDVEDLVLAPPNHIPEALGDDIGHGSLAVWAEGEGGHASTGLAAALGGIAPFADVVAVHLQLAFLQSTARSFRPGGRGN